MMKGMGAAAHRGIVANARAQHAASKHHHRGICARAIV